MAARRVQPRRSARRVHVHPHRHRQAQRRRPASLARRSAPNPPPRSATLDWRSAELALRAGWSRQSPDEYHTIADQGHSALHPGSKVTQRISQVRQAPLPAPQPHREHVRPPQDLAAMATCGKMMPTVFFSAVALTVTAIFRLRPARPDPMSATLILCRRPAT